MAVKTNNGYNLSDFSVNISEAGDLVAVQVECFANNRVDAPVRVYSAGKIDNLLISDPKLFYFYLSNVITRQINNLITTEITQPEKCECQSRDWFRTHPEDFQEYWRCINGKVYPKNHTALCPNNPINRRKADG